MRTPFVAFAAFGILVLGQACSISTTPNSITGKTQNKFVNSPDTTRTATADWTNQAIVIQSDGIGAAFGDAGVTVIGDPSVTKVTVTAQIVAMADPDDKASADLTIQDVLTSFTLTESTTSISIKCGHGGAHGTSSPGNSGCQLLTVHVPSGTAANPVNVTIGSGNGGIQASGLVGSVKAQSNGSGSTSVSVSPAKGSNIDVSGGDEVVVALPSDFAADMITLTADPSAKTITTDFPDVTSGKGRGQAGTGAASIKVTSTGILDSDTVTLKKQ